MGTHPIFESDFDCLTEKRMIEIGEVLEVTLRKSPSEPLGFSIRGGRDRPSLRDDNGIFISNIKENGTAARLADTNEMPFLRNGDKLIAINGNSLLDIEHSEAVSYFMDSGETVTLKFIPRATELLVERRERKLEAETRRRNLYTICISVLGVSGVSFLLYKKYGSFNRLKSAVQSLWSR